MSITKSRWDPVGNQTYNDGLVAVSGLLQEYNKVYSYDDLVSRRFPKGLDESKLEVPTNHCSLKSYRSGLLV